MEKKRSNKNKGRKQEVQDLEIRLQQGVFPSSHEVIWTEFGLRNRYTAQFFNELFIVHSWHWSDPGSVYAKDMKDMCRLSVRAAFSQRVLRGVPVKTVHLPSDDIDRLTTDIVEEKDALGCWWCCRLAIQNCHDFEAWERFMCITVQKWALKRFDFVMQAELCLALAMQIEIALHLDTRRQSKVAKWFGIQEGPQLLRKGVQMWGDAYTYFKKSKIHGLAAMCLFCQAKMALLLPLNERGDIHSAIQEQENPWEANHHYMEPLTRHYQERQHFLWGELLLENSALDSGPLAAEWDLIRGFYASPATAYFGLVSAKKKKWTCLGWIRTTFEET